MYEHNWYIICYILVKVIVGCDMWVIKKLKKKKKKKTMFSAACLSELEGR